MSHILLGLQDLPRDGGVYSSVTVNQDLRAFFKMMRKTVARKTQVEVASDGGVEQSTISKIERMHEYQPSAELFLRAVSGLGMRPSRFFQLFEDWASGRAATSQAPQAPLRFDGGAAGRRDDAIIKTLTKAIKSIESRHAILITDEEAATRRKQSIANAQAEIRDAEMRADFKKGKRKSLKRNS